MQLWSVDPKGDHLRLRVGLDDVVDVNGMSPGMRPEAVVHLFGGNELACNGRSSMEQRTEFDRLDLCETGYRGDMALRFHNQGSNTKGADAVLDYPTSSPMDQATGKINFPP